ncbi:hypothetical protein [Methylobacterium aerolatum]|uniref:Low affinity Fe/Cu permease n=1 Tax=Methylobacterium aerolatum TaxID=418708 RepID=A0ABU0HYP0_9HYPH|nr:hypothetical protein [Methylobacterium aerolatum]MDQ0446982.1 low affinity Fe/Cu permease [Methylobacterium aerolatum]GJD36773.1 hypothetical protein FMGBMHLM_3696 [Methylobacterium aerolatum]
MIFENFLFAIISAIVLSLVGYVHKFDEKTWAIILIATRFIGLGAVVLFIFNIEKSSLQDRADKSLVAYKAELAKQLIAVESLKTANCEKVNYKRQKDKKCDDFINISNYIRRWQVFGFNDTVGYMRNNTETYWLLKYYQSDIGRKLSENHYRIGNLLGYQADLLKSDDNIEAISASFAYSLSDYWGIILSLIISCQIVADVFKLYLSDRKIKENKKRERREILAECRWRSEMYKR